MHWQLGEADMARRAGVTPFSLTATAIEPSSSQQLLRRSPPRGLYQQHQQTHTHHHSQGSIRADTGSAGGSSSSGAPSPRYGRGGHPAVPLPPPPPLLHGDRTLTGFGGGSGVGSGSVTRPVAGGGRWEGERSTGPRSMRSGGAEGGGPTDPSNPMYHYQQQPFQQHYQSVVLGLPPIQTGSGPPPLQHQHQQMERMGASGPAGGQGGAAGALPSFAEITTGVSPYSTPAYSLGASPAPSQTASPGPGPLLPGLSSYPPGHGGSGGRSSEPPTSAGGSGKRRASPNMEPREQRRRYLQSPRYDGGSGVGRGGGGSY
ncbi:myb DNA-binding domain containing protein [Niveomyces insectorum RCEF 264]|uniref:Myb DNA-binding domain containing protein n=1 Tax=Niveomyces insectorum RCEF 264 TaxID=1081102 RepID=A0A167YMC8_9HYPO|nr:myb DNA-binding domain containing protein [Niveomyces insectorum RCEF 264]